MAKYSKHCPEFKAQVVLAILSGEKSVAQISIAMIGQPTQNAHSERVIRSIKEEEIYLSEYHSLADATAQIGHFIDVVYQRKRIHSALGYLTSAEFEA